MTDIFTLHGDYETRPGSGSRSLDPEVSARIDERVAIKAKTIATVELDDDAAFDVDMSNLAEANIVIIKSNLPITARFTSTAGATQSIPIDGVYESITKSVGYTAIDITRLPGQTTTVRIFLAEKAP